LNVLKAGSIVKHGDNRLKNDCIAIQLSQKIKDFAAFLRSMRQNHSKSHRPISFHPMGELLILSQTITRNAFSEILQGPSEKNLLNASY